MTIYRLCISTIYILPVHGDMKMCLSPNERAFWWFKAFTSEKRNESRTLLTLLLCTWHLLYFTFQSSYIAQKMFLWKVEMKVSFLCTLLSCISHGLLVDTQDIDYYAVLGVRRTAGRDEIRSSYKALMLELHPDRNRVIKD